MKLFLSILGNATILYLIAFFLSGNPEKNISDGVVFGCNACSYASLEALQAYIVGGMILGIINSLIRPILTLLTLPLFFLFLGLTSLLVNGLVLYLFSFIFNDILQIQGISYSIVGITNFIIAVAIFTFFNTLFSFLLSKK